MINDKNILAIIPARGGSKGLPRKNVKELDGKPLISYTIEEAKKSKYIDRIVVSTEDEEIAKVSKQFGAQVPCLRPQELAEDYSTSVDCVLHMLKWLKYSENYTPDYVCLLQCTSPLRDSDDIDGAIEKIIEIGMDAVVSICEAEVNPYWTTILNGDKLEYFLEEGRKITRRQELPKVYRVNGAIYLIETKVFVENKTFEPENLTGFIMNNNRSIDIDNNEDFMLAELLIKQRNF
ncbi:cytidylyltransferase domain-containing protein [Inconstantimicrobium mannanitabidum]|uniref:Uncharacterized protein n=1 Tax=Inconstantimicrobium mannanitabidum TaxID=1604901 RepID=A0ACB5R8J7_9CLOT|nr:acylneuraminate cytidylyltransferase family protein [Clostridium sp. TW13]GKX65523.1 hypothetical protein rsdtw13_07810 [Clostridium sp. TW13]